MADFKVAFSTVGPSMQRGFQVQVDKMNWNDVGGLEEVKKVKSHRHIQDALYV
jgi:transitional endoplasmic reticulum ATPase